MYLVIMPGHRVFIETPPKFGYVFIQSNPQCPLGPPNILEATRALNKVDNPFRGAGNEGFHLI